MDQNPYPRLTQHWGSSPLLPSCIVQNPIFYKDFPKRSVTFSELGSDMVWPISAGRLGSRYLYMPHSFLPPWKGVGGTRALALFYIQLAFCQPLVRSKEHPQRDWQVCVTTHRHYTHWSLQTPMPSSWWYAANGLAIANNLVPSESTFCYDSHKLSIQMQDMQAYASTLHILFRIASKFTSLTA